MTFPDYEAAIQAYIDQEKPEGFRPDQLSGHEGRMVLCIVDAALVDETLNTLAKSLDDGYEWQQLIPRLMGLPPTTVLYREATPGEWATGKIFCQDMPIVQVWPKGPA